MIEGTKGEQSVKEKLVKSNNFKSFVTNQDILEAVVGFS